MDSTRAMEVDETGDPALGADMGGGEVEQTENLEQVDGGGDRFGVEEETSVKPVILDTIRKCSFCRRYITAANMSRHVKEIHPNRIMPKKSQGKYLKKAEIKQEAKTFKCPSPCDKAFERKETLERHQKRKTCIFNQTETCIFCSKGFVTKDSYWNHLSDKRCPKQFSCKKCNIFYFKLSDFQNHEKGCSIINSP